MATFSADGVTYKSSPTTDGCEGCAGHTNTSICNALPDCAGIIWVKKEVPAPETSEPVEAPAVVAEPAKVEATQVGGSHYQRAIQPWDTVGMS